MSRDVPSIAAAVLPVLLGLGLIYLYAMSHLDAHEVIVALAAMVIVITAVIRVAGSRRLE